MIALPRVSVTELDRFADWVELATLLEPSGLVATATIADILHDAGLVGGSEEDLLPGEETYRDEVTFAEADAADRFVEQVWERLQTRITQLGNKYPYSFTGDRFARRVESWELKPAFTMLLVADLARSYPGSKISIEAASGFPTLFEVVVVAAQRGLLGGASARFEWPPRVSGSIEERITRFGNLLGLDVEILKGKVKPQDKDRGLDVATRLSFGDDGRGTLFVLTQCATGKHWRRKKGEPAIGEWHNVLRWEAKLVRAIAVPWRLDSPEYIENHLHFDEAIILDRLRLAFGDPDRYLADSDKKAVRNWCNNQIRKLPGLE